MRASNWHPSLGLCTPKSLIPFFLLAAGCVALPAQNVQFSTLASFDGTNGSSAGYGPLIRGSDGSFYGTTIFGGANGSGNVYKLTATGELSTLYSFCAQPGCTDGKQPTAGLVLGSDGNLYGTTSGGGDELYYGTVFKITPDGVLTTLHSFHGYPDDGYGPTAELVLGSDGNFYGTTEYGGSYTFGTVFKVSPAGDFTVLYNFDDGDHGSDPRGGLIQGRDGNFYGTTFSGGLPSPYCSFSGCGTAFKITSAGVLTTIYSFCRQPDCADGSGPWAGVTQGADGNFYGTTYNGGTGYSGNVFQLTPAGSLTTLYSFCVHSPCLDGEEPYAGVTQGRDGALYGTTSYGGANLTYGTVFRVTPSGDFTTLHSFNGTDGASPWGGLLLAPDGFFYGTTSVGGVHGYGNIFRVGVVSGCAVCRR